MTSESREQMEGFVRRAERVARSSYLDHIKQQGGLAANITWDETSASFSNNFPDEEAIDALVLTARMFVQNNDPVSFGNMSCLEADPGISREWKDRFRDARQQLNAFLDSLTEFSQPDNHYTHREVFEIILYGGLAHTSAKFAPTYNGWISNPLSAMFYVSDFHAVLLHLSNVAVYVAHCTRDELAGKPVPPLT